MDKKEEKQKENLYECVVSSVEIYCEKCRKNEVIHGADELDAVSAFYDDGWRMIRNKCICPTCNKKKRLS